MIVSNGLSRWRSLVSAAGAAGAVVLACTVLAGSARAQDVGPPVIQDKTRKSDVVREIDFTDSKDSGFVAMPMPIIDPTIGNGIGALGLWHYRHDPEDKVSPPSSTLVATGVTDSDSFFVGAVQNSHWKEDRYRFDGMIAFADLKLPFFGVGDNQSNASTEYNIEGLIAQPKLLARVLPNIYLGGMFSLFGGDVKFREPQRPDLPSRGLNATTAGLGPVVLRDTRDNGFFPWEGSVTDLRYLRYDKALGGDFDYHKAEAFYSDYTKLDFGEHELAKEVVAAFRLDAQFVDGDFVPFWDLPALSLRGFPRTKYIDENMWQAQGELRWLVHRRVGVVGFFGLGQVASTFSNFGRRDVIFSSGFGVRYRADEDQRINIGFDLAFGSKGEEAIYFRIGEAF